MQDLWEAFGLDSELEKLEVKDKTKSKGAKKSAKQKATEKAAMDKKLAKAGVQKSETNSSKAEHVTGNFSFSQLNQDTKLWLTVTREEYRVSDLLPGYFHPSGKPISKGQKPYTDEEISLGIDREPAVETLEVDELKAEEPTTKEKEAVEAKVEEQNAEESKAEVSETEDPKAEESTAVEANNDANGKEPTEKAVDQSGTNETESQSEEKDSEGNKTATSKTNTVIIDTAITVSILRKRLAKEFPQFSSTSMTQFYLDKKVNAIHVIIQPQRKGASLPSLPGLEMESQLPFDISDLLPKKIKKEEFLIFLEAAKRVYLSEGTEIQYDVYHDYRTDAYILDEPVQIRDREYVIPQANLDMQMKYRFIGSIHSHHEFQPYPSPTDDKSERSFHLYGILGNFDARKRSVVSEYDCSFINEDNVKFRTFYDGQYYSIPFDCVVSADKC